MDNQAEWGHQYFKSDSSTGSCRLNPELFSFHLRWKGRRKDWRGGNKPDSPSTTSVIAKVIMEKEKEIKLFVFKLLTDWQSGSDLLWSIGIPPLTANASWFERVTQKKTDRSISLCSFKKVLLIILTLKYHKYQIKCVFYLSMYVNNCQ